MAGLNLGSAFETAVAQLAGVDPATFDPGSLDIAMINPSGPSTIRFTVHFSVDTAALKTLVQEHSA